MELLAIHSRRLLTFHQYLLTTVSVNINMFTGGYHQASNLYLFNHGTFVYMNIQWSPYIRPPSPAATPLIRPDLYGTDSFLSIIYPSPAATPLTRPAATLFGFN